MTIRHTLEKIGAEPPLPGASFERLFGGDLSSRLAAAGLPDEQVRDIVQKIQTVGRVGKLGLMGGTALGAALGGYKAIKSSKEEGGRPGIGTALGGAGAGVLGGGIGTAIGAPIGGLGGAITGLSLGTLVSALSRGRYGKSPTGLGFGGWGTALGALGGGLFGGVKGSLAGGHIVGETLGSGEEVERRQLARDKQEEEAMETLNKEGFSKGRAALIAGGGALGGAAVVGTAALLAAKKSRKQSRKQFGDPQSGKEKLNMALGALYSEYGPPLEKHATLDYFYRATKNERDREALGPQFCKLAGAMKKNPWELAADVVRHYSAFENIAKTAGNAQQRELAAFYIQWADGIVKRAYVTASKIFAKRLLSPGVKKGLSKSNIVKPKTLFDSSLASAPLPKVVGGKSSWSPAAQKGAGPRAGKGLTAADYVVGGGVLGGAGYLGSKVYGASQPQYAQPQYR